MLPTEEYEEEEPLGAIVVEQRDRWFKVQVPDGAAWVHAADGDEYFSLQQLLLKRPAYLTDVWDGTLAQVPGGPRRSLAGSRRLMPVRFLESRETRGAMWLRHHSAKAGSLEPGEPELRFSSVNRPRMSRSTVRIAAAFSAPRPRCRSVRKS